MEEFAGCRGKPWELPWENSGGAGETRGTGLELRTEIHTGRTTGGMDHRSDPNKQSETRQLQKPVGDLISRRTKHRGEGLGILRGNEDRGRVCGVPWETVGAAVGELRWGR